MNNLNNMSPDQRKQFIDDKLKQKGLFVDTPTTLTNEQKILLNARNIWSFIQTNVANPLLKAITLSSHYDSFATQKLYITAFQDQFRTWSKDELIFLVSVMHAEELEKQTKQSFSAGIHGEDMDKPI